MRKVGKESEPETRGSVETRVAYVSTDPGVPIFGSKGASVHLQAVVTSLLRRGVRVELFSSSVEGIPPPGLKEIVVHPIMNWPQGALSGVRSKVNSSNDSLRSALEGCRPFDFVYERYALWSYAGMEYALSKNIRGVLEVNSPLIEEEEKYRQLRNRTLAKEVARRTFRASSKILAVSKGVAGYLGHFPEAGGKVKVVHNGVDPTRFPEKLKPTRPAPLGIFTIGFVGSLKPWHGLDTLAIAYKLLCAKGGRTRLLVVGEGPLRKEFETSLTDKGLIGACEFTGSVTPAEVPGLIASMDVGVAPYLFLEGFYFSPLKILEYMAAGKPTVASGIGDIPELVRDGKDGILVPPGNPEVLAAALHKLRTDPALRAAMGSSARDRVVHSHTWDMVATEILRLGGLTRSRRPLAR